MEGGREGEERISGRMEEEEEGDISGMEEEEEEEDISGMVEDGGGYWVRRYQGEWMEK